MANKLTDKNTKKIKKIVDKALVRSKNTTAEEQIKAISVLVKSIGEFNVVKQKDFNLMFELIEAGEMEALDILLNLKLNVNEVNEKGETAIHVALKKEKYEVAKKLLLKTNNLEARDNEGSSYLMLAIENKAREVIKFLLEKEVTFDKPNIFGETEVHIAAKVGDSETIQKLISLGAKINTKNKDKETPSLVAQLNGHGGISLLLSEINYGVDEEQMEENLITERAHKLDDNYLDINTREGVQLADLYIKGDITYQEYLNVFNNYKKTNEVDFNLLKQKNLKPKPLNSLKDFSQAFEELRGSYKSGMYKKDEYIDLFRKLEREKTRWEEKNENADITDIVEK